MWSRLKDVLGRKRTQSGTSVSSVTSVPENSSNLLNPLDSENLPITANLPGPDNLSGTMEKKDEEIKIVESVQQPRPEPQYPNVFVAVQVDNAQIQDALVEVQDTCVAYDSRLSTFTVPVEKSHITLLVLNVAEDQMEQARDLMTRVIRKKEVQALKGGFQVKFHGVETFPGKRVLYAKPVTGHEELEILYRSVLEAFSGAGFKSFSADFKPHLTVMKYQRGRGGNLGRISEDSFDSVKEKVFGTQTMRGIQLLSMFKPASDNGYYYSECEYEF